MARNANATEKMKRECLIATAVRQGAPILCAICGLPIMPGQRMAFDHGHALGRDGANEVANLFPVHDDKDRDSEFNCHTRKTAHPRGPHTAIGGDTFEHHKTGRIAKAAIVNKPTLGTERPGKPASRRLTSRPFPPRGARPMNRKRRAAP